MKKALIFIALLACPLFAAGQQLGVWSVGFYNVENLFDTELDTTVLAGEEFTPEGPNNWTEDKYQKKLHNIATVISQLGKERTPAGVALLGISEVENRRVVEDLVKREEIADRNYQVVHYDSPDRRGVDVAAIYNPAIFKYESSVPYRYVLPGRPDFVTRDILLVSGRMAGERFHMLVCHWPSRSGGKSSDQYRENAARISRHIIDSIHVADPASKVILVGDLNDDPTNKSCRVVMDAKRTPEEVAPGGVLNTTWKLFDKGIGSLGYQGKWNLFDQAMVSESSLGKDYSSLRWWKTEIFNRDFLVNPEGRYKGYPLRTYSGGTFQNGYSDHFPVVVYFVKSL